MNFWTHFNLSWSRKIRRENWFLGPFFSFTRLTSYWNSNFNKLLKLLCDQINFKRLRDCDFLFSSLLFVFPPKPSIVKIAYSNIYWRCRKLHREKSSLSIKAVSYSLSLFLEFGHKEEEGKSKYLAVSLNNIESACFHISSTFILYKLR